METERMNKDSLLLRLLFDFNLKTALELCCVVLDANSSNTLTSVSSRLVGGNQVMPVTALVGRARRC